MFFVEVSKFLVEIFDFDHFSFFEKMVKNRKSEPKISITFLVFGVRRSYFVSTGIELGEMFLEEIKFFLKKKTRMKISIFW